MILGNSVIKEWEYLLAEHCKQDYCIATSNASAGIMGVFMALGLSRKEIITTPLTWSGAVGGLLTLGCKIKFCDVEPHFLTMDFEKLENLITPNTKAVFTTDFLGYPCRLDKIKEICQKHGIYLIHDAASSFGSIYRGYQSGYFADVSIYSFGRKKLFSIGEGGAIISNNESIYKKLISSIGHPERQQIEYGSILNPFSLNISMNILGAEYGIKKIKSALQTINEKQRKVNQLLESMEVFDEDYQPNFYKILIHPNQIKKIDSEFGNVLGEIPFTPIFLEKHFKKQKNNLVEFENTMRFSEYRVWGEE